MQPQVYLRMVRKIPWYGTSLTIFALVHRLHEPLWSVFQIGCSRS